MFLYKFLERQFLESFFKTGSLRIGTIYDFKDTISHTAARADSSEGKHELVRRISSPLKIDKNTQEPIVSEIFRFEGEGYSTIQDMSLLSSRDSGDGFIFCTSRFYSTDIFKRWHKDCAKNDACYAILDSKGFIFEVTNAIRDSICQVINNDIVYTSDPIPYDSPEAQLNPAVTKSAEKYLWQNENRTIWVPKLPPLIVRPFIVNAPKARKYCIPLSYIENGDIKYYSVNQ